MILVTGGCGFIGSHFIDYLINNTSHVVVNVDALTYASNGEIAKMKHPRYEFINASINDSETMQEILAQHQPKYIVNFAAESHVTKSIEDPEDTIETNIMGTYALLKSIAKYGMPVRLHHVSSDEVYGSLQEDDQSFTESSPYNPSTPYAASKAAADHLVMAWAKTYGLDVTISSSANNYGIRQHPEKLIPFVITSAIKGQDITMHGSGTQTRDWIHASDHASAIYTILKHGKSGEKYNIGANNEISNLDVATAICMQLDAVAPKDRGTYADQITFINDRPANDKRYSTNNSKMLQLGWSPKIKFEEEIYNMVLWYVRAEAVG